MTGDNASISLLVKQVTFLASNHIQPKKSFTSPRQLLSGTSVMVMAHKCWKNRLDSLDSQYLSNHYPCQTANTMSFPVKVLISSTLKIFVYINRNQLNININDCWDTFVNKTNMIDNIK